MDKLSILLESLDFNDDEKHAWKQLCFTLRPEGQIEVIKFLESLVQKAK